MLFTIGKYVDKLGCFLHDGKVRRKIGIKNVIKANFS